MTRLRAVVCDEKGEWEDEDEVDTGLLGSVVLVLSDGDGCDDCCSRSRQMNRTSPVSEYEGN